MMLSDLCDLVTDQVHPSDCDGACVYLGLEHLAPGRLIPVASGVAADVNSHKFRFRQGDVLYGKLRPYLDKAVLAETDGVCTTELLVLRSKPNADPRFLACAVHSPNFIEHAMSGVTGVQHPRTSWTHISGFILPDFDKRTQTKIAAILWHIHDLAVAATRAEEAARSLKSAAMRELFARGLRGEPQKETEIGPVPESWDVAPLGEIAAIDYGAQAAVASATDPSIGTLILTNVNISLDGTIDLEKKRYYKVPDSQHDRLSLSRGDVLFNWRSGSPEHVGKTAYFDLDQVCTYSSFILRFRPHRAVSGKYLFRYLTYLRAQGYFSAQRNVSSINSVFNASLSATIPVWYPPENEQRSLIEILDAIDRKIDLHRRKRAVLDELFKSLLHKLMTGEVRVADLDLSALPASAEATP